MSKAANLLKAARNCDKATKSGRATIRLLRGKYSKLFLAMSEEVYESAMRTFDRNLK